MDKNTVFPAIGSLVEGGFVGAMATEFWLRLLFCLLGLVLLAKIVELAWFLLGVRVVTDLFGRK